MSRRVTARTTEENGGERRHATDEALGAERRGEDESHASAADQRELVEEELCGHQAETARDEPARREAHHRQGERTRARKVAREQEAHARGAKRAATEQRLRDEREFSDRALGRERDESADRGRLLAEAREARVLAEAATRRAEDATHAAEAATRRAEDATRMRDEFLAIVSHDLRNPIGATLMNATLAITRTPATEEGAPLRRSLEAIQRASRRALRMIDDLLDVAAIDAGGLSLRLKPFRVTQLVAETLESLVPLADERSLSLSSSIATDPSEEVRCDSGRILQVFSNLIGNAIKFTPPGGTITLRVWPHGSDVVFAVSDTGQGIPEDRREDVFARFWQAAPGRGRGVGLGLYISKGIVEAHGGRLWFESEVGAGTTFFFALPALPRAGGRPGCGDVQQL